MRNRRPAGEVHGSIYTVLGERFVGNKPDGSLSPRIMLPDISVNLVDTRTSAKSIVVQTDLDGTFTIPAQPQAIYKLCWQATGFVAGCTATPFVLRSRNEILQPVAIAPAPGILTGRVTFKDRKPCRFLAPIFGVNTFTTLRAEQPNRPTRSVRANTSGYYVFGGLATANAKLTAICEKAQTVATAQPQSTGSTAVATNLVLPNMTPTAIAYASTGSGIVRTASAGSKVTAVASTTAPGGHPLSYRWSPDPPQSGFASSNTPTLNWQIPTGGLATLYVLASDGFGGYAMSKVALSTTPNRVVFSGTVRSNSGAAIEGARVTIGGVSINTDAAGYFALTLPGEAPRYVIGIEKTGFKLFSRALYAPVNGVVYRLSPTRQVTVDPRGPIHIVEKVPRQIPTAAAWKWSSKPGSIAAGGDGRGAPATVPLTITAGTYAIRNPEDQLPGDYAGVDKNGKQMRLSSYGASFVGIQDAVGNKFNLAPGRKAKIRQPIDPALLATAPAAIALWQYDETGRRLGRIRPGHARRQRL